MSEPTYPITGIPLIPGEGLPLRQEITAWYNNDANKYQISLFMQALTIFKKVPVDQLLSFFQIAGIHCYPLVGWDGEKGVPEPGKPTDPFPGYCAHNRVTFPTWHRPYMLLYEQVLYSIMGDIITSWNLSGAEEKTWRTAASQFRLPYWDWARKQDYWKNFAIPQVCTLDYIDVTLPGGQKKSIPNPLVGFTNPMQIDGKNVAMGDPAMGPNAIKDDTDVPDGWEPLPWSKCIGTSRYGILSGVPPEEWINGVNNWQGANAAMADPPWYGQGSGSFADAVSRMFSPGYFDSWETFASTIHNNPSSATNFMSIEFIHNIIHNATGGLYMSESEAKGNPGYQGLGLGHMSDVPVAAFDPIFWFHHCNIDRQLAIWQILNSKMWFNKPQKDDPLPTDPLLPFHYDTNRSLWFSDKCRDWTQLNYQYDDLVPKPDAINPDGSVNEERYAQDLRTYINTIYPSTSQIVKETPGYTLDGGKFNDYVINVIYDRYALKGRAYAILFFLGDPPQALSTYRQSDNFIGQVYTFSAPTEVGGAIACGNCAKQKSSKVLSKAHIPITLHLLAKARPQSQLGGGAAQAPLGIPGLGLGALDPEPVEEILQQQLKWVFVEIGGRRHDPADFPDTEIAVLHGQGQHAATLDHLPTYAGYKKLERATRDKMTGSGHPQARLGLIRDDPQ
ncbi:Di-copper centre-containing protein [Glonium stellatum]|uniref:tyrosinase n=1 Tax=Glonium stellatum TaxID=574774 RepID=A0A8E2F331_9PEZI|nr:Di-copper centre-containing protein [Glonium stellatum]